MLKLKHTQDLLSVIKNLISKDEKFWPFFHPCSMLCFKAATVWPHFQSSGTIITVLFLLKINGTEEGS